MNFKIIALTGPKGSGKDTVASMIAKRYQNVSVIAFADPIKKVINNLFDLDPSNNIQYDAFKRADLTYQLPGYLSHRVSAREVVREIGMLMRSYDEKQFTEYVVSSIACKSNDIWVVSDLRFDNEYMVLRSLGAKIINIKRPNYEYDGHITERGFNDSLVDYTILNDGDLKYLDMRVESVVENIIKEWE